MSSLHFPWYRNLASVVRWLTLHKWTLDWTQLLNWSIARFSLYRLGSDLTENMCHVSECMPVGPLPNTGHCADDIENNSSVVRMRVYWPVAQNWSWRGPYRKHFFQYLFYCCVRVFPAPPRNGVCTLQYFFTHSNNLKPNGILWATPHVLIVQS
jgi:hypothetical protein